MSRVIPATAVIQATRANRIHVQEAPAHREEALRTVEEEVEREVLQEAIRGRDQDRDLYLPDEEEIGATVLRRPDRRLVLDFRREGDGHHPYPQ